MDVIVGQRIVPLFLRAPVDGIALHIPDNVLGFIELVVLHIALGQPCARPAVDGGLRGVEATHITECGDGRVEIGLMKLRPSHKHPRFPQDWSILAPGEPLQIALRLAARLVPLRAALDGVELDGLLRLENGLVEIGLAQLLAILVAHRIEGDNLGVVVLVACLFLQGTLDVGLLAIKIGIVTGMKRVPPPGSSCILLGGASRQNQQSSQQGG